MDLGDKLTYSASRLNFDHPDAVINGTVRVLFKDDFGLENPSEEQIKAAAEEHYKWLAERIEKCTDSNFSAVDVTKFESYFGKFSDDILNDICRRWEVEAILPNEYNMNLMPPFRPKPNQKPKNKKVKKSKGHGKRKVLENER